MGETQDVLNNNIVNFLPPKQAEVYQKILESGPNGTSIPELAKNLGMPYQNVHLVVKELKRKGLVKFKEEWGKSHKIRITVKKGTNLFLVVYRQNR